MKLKEYIRANPGFLQRVLRCDNADELYRVVRLEGIEASPENIDYVALLLNLGDHELEGVMEDKDTVKCVGGMKPSLSMGGSSSAFKLQPPSIPGQMQLDKVYRVPISKAQGPSIPTGTDSSGLWKTFSKANAAATSPPLFPSQWGG